MSKRSADAQRYASPPAKRARTDAITTLPWRDLAECDGLFGDFLSKYLDPISQRALLCASTRDAQLVLPHLRPWRAWIDVPLDHALLRAIEYDHAGSFRSKWQFSDAYDTHIETHHAINCALALLAMPLRERKRSLVDVSIDFLWELACHLQPVHADEWALIMIMRMDAFADSKWFFYWFFLRPIPKATAVMFMRALARYLSPPISEAIERFIEGGCNHGDMHRIWPVQYDSAI